MTSPAKIAANRRNARRSTGPRSAAGKARARRNAFRHGLATPASLDHVAMDRIDDLVVALTGDFQGELEFELATLAAEAQAEIERVRQTKVPWLTGPSRIYAARAVVCCPRASAPHWHSPARLRSSCPASAMNAGLSQDAIGRCRRWQGCNENYGGRRQSKLSDLLVRSRPGPGNPFREDVLRLEVEQTENFARTHEFLRHL